MPLSTLCQRCGLCCDGTLFHVVPLQPAEAAALRERGLEVVERPDGSRALRQRCAALEGTRCRVYEDRPGGCRRYTCMLYAALAEHEVSLDEALGVVDQAHALIAAVGAHLPAGADAGTSVMQRARRADQDGALSPDASATRQRAEAFLDRHLRGARGG